jgi:hypothetical protein
MINVKAEKNKILINNLKHDLHALLEPMLYEFLKYNEDKPKDIVRAAMLASIFDVWKDFDKNYFQK